MGASDYPVTEVWIPNTGADKIITKMSIYPPTTYDTGNAPFGVAVDLIKRYAYVASQDRVDRYDPNGSRLAWDIGANNAAKGIALDKNCNVIFMDDYLVLKDTASHVPVWGIELPDNTAIGLCIDRNDDVWITDGSYVHKLSGVNGSVLGSFIPSIGADLKGIAYKDPYIYVADQEIQAVYKMRLNGTVATTYYTGLPVYGIALDVSGNIWFTSYYTHIFGKITPAGAITMYSSQGNYPSGLGLTADGYLWIDSSGANIFRYSLVSPSNWVAFEQSPSDTGLSLGDLTGYQHLNFVYQPESTEIGSCEIH